MLKEITVFQNSDQSEYFYYGSSEEAMEIAKELNLTKIPILKMINPTRADSDFDVLFDGKIYENQFTLFKEENIHGFEHLLYCRDRDLLDLYPVFHEWLKLKFDGIVDLEYTRTVDGKVIPKT